MRIDAVVRGGLAILLSTIAAALPAVDLVTPDQWLAAQPKPAFRAGHTLPRLTRYGYIMALPTRIELTEHWGYALEFSSYVGPETVARLDDPTSDEAKVAALAMSDPQRYPLVVITSRQMPGIEAPESAWVHDANGHVINGQGVSIDGNTWSEEAGALFSPEAPDEVWQMAGNYRADPLAAMIARGVPISIVLNGGEYGLGLEEPMWPSWSQDPVILAAVAALGGQYADRQRYASTKKANSERIIADAVRAAVPQRSLYIYYTAGGRTERNRYWGIDSWGPMWEHSRGIGDLPSNEVYYRSGSFGGYNFTGFLDVLTAALNAVSYEIASGDPLSYNWLSNGWIDAGVGRSDDSYIADLSRWVGFLKCYYTAGMIGGNVGAYGLPPAGGYGASFPADVPPPFIKQLVATAHVHALFSQVEDLVRNGDLLPGPMPHAVSPSSPAYEFPTGDSTARVLARRHRQQATWLITAWASDGANRTVMVYIPELGRVTVEARDCGSVYTASVAGGTVTLTRLDDEGATYSAVANGTPLVFAQDLSLPPPANPLVWLSADQGLTTDDAGKVSAWISHGTAAITVSQSDAARQPMVVPNALGGRAALRFVDQQTWLINNVIGSAGDAFAGNLSILAVFSGEKSKTNQRVVSLTRAGGNDYQSGQGFSLSASITEQAPPAGNAKLKMSNGSLDAALSTLAIGDMYSPGGTFGFTGDLAEVLITANPTSGDVAMAQQYFQEVYHINTVTTLAYGSFEEPAVTGYRYAPVVPGWLFTGPAAIQANGSVWTAPTAPDGIQTAVLQGTAHGLGQIAQTVTLAAGSYRLQFSAARRSGQIQPLRCAIDGRPIGGLITPAGDGFSDCASAPFTVIAGIHAIQIAATISGGDASTFIDSVILVPLTPRERLTGRFGLRQGDAGWDAADDLSGDGIINAADLSLLLRQ